MELIEGRNVTDYGQLDSAIREVAKKYTYQEFLDEDTIELCDELLHVINTNPDYRYLRLFKFHELENEIVSFKEICFHKHQADRWMPWINEQMDKISDKALKREADELRKKNCQEKRKKIK